MAFVVYFGQWTLETTLLLSKELFMVLYIIIFRNLRDYLSLAFFPKIILFFFFLTKDEVVSGSGNLPNLLDTISLIGNFRGAYEQIILCVPTCHD